MQNSQSVNPAADVPPVEPAATEARRLTENILGANPVLGLTRHEVADSTRRLLRLFALHPRLVVQKQREFLAELARIVLGRSEILADPRDRRFAQRIWQQNGYYRRLMQAYIAWSRSLYGILDGIEATPRDRERARFILMQLVNAASPSNYPLGNPDFLSSLVRTRGLSLLRGLRNLADDLVNNHGLPKQVDERPFKPGRNLACSEGAVVFRNPVCELIQYRPQTEQVRKTPLLVIPPQINKYYIVDLARDRSLVRYASEQGVQVFCISWRNPTEAQRDWGMETYVSAAKEALDAVREITGSDSVNLLAACAGGFTTAVLLGHLWAAGEGHKIKSLTLLVTVLDTSGDSLLGLFANESGIRSAMRRSRRRGVLDGAEMARAFAWLRPADLIWGLAANNYLMGNDPPALDVLYWNNDTTRLPAQFHADVLSLFQSNPLARAGAMKILGTVIDLKRVDCDVFIVAGISDHITPWQACYQSTRLFGGSTEFLLSASGHIQSIVNPPGDPRAKYYVNPDYRLQPAEWLEQATLEHGSWWTRWRDWLLPRSGETGAAAPGLGSSRFPAGDAAPGRYVFQR